MMTVIVKCFFLFNLFSSTRLVGVPKSGSAGFIYVKYGFYWLLTSGDFQTVCSQLKTSPKYKMIEIFSLLLRSMGLQLYEQIWRFTNLKSLFQFLFDISGKTLCQDETMWLQSKRKKTISLSSKAKRGRS